MQTYKLIAFDLDGTLLNNKMKLSQETCRSITTLERKGILAIVISGRPVQSILFAAGSFTFPYISGLNGAVIYSPPENRIITKAVIDRECAAFCLEYLKKKKICSLVCTSRDNYMAYYSDSYFTRLYRDSMNPRPFEKLDGTEDIVSIQLMTGSETECSRVEEDLRAGAGFSLSIENCGYNFLQINKKGIDKAYALKYIIQQLKIKPDSTIAVGDSNSDISMIKAAGIGIGMAGGPELLLEASDDITEKDNDNNGALHLILKKYIT